MALREYVIFKLQGEFYGVEVEYVENIEKLVEITRVPYTEPSVKGVVNLRGIIVPVIDLRIKFGLGQVEYGEDTRMIVVNYDDGKIGMLVDSSSETFQVNDEDIDSATNISKKSSIEYIRSIGKKDGRVVMLIDLAKVLSTEV
ncbi:MAG: chemotaxis protein CheW [Bacillota bacterium]|nr:chemotaxis protein CheW [Bacillota bacterium]